MSARKRVSDWSTDFDHLDPQWTANPYPIWDELRQKCPVAHTERFNGVSFPLRYEDIRGVAYDTEHFSSRQVILFDGNPPIEPAPPVNSDPPAHRNDKRLLLPVFSPTAIARYEPQTRAICRDLLDRIGNRNTCDGAVDYVQEIPVRVTASMLGVSEQDGDRFRKWIHELIELGPADPAVLIRAREEVAAFFADELEKRKTLPTDDLITYLLHARMEGEPLDEISRIRTLRVLLVAGIDTTWSAIGACLWHLAGHAGDRKRLVEEPELIPTAIEEFLRAYAPVTMAREVVKDTHIGGCPVKKGEKVMLSFPAANRDPSVFPDADRVILDRTPNRHTTFGLGIHRCIGSNLARMEMTIALEEWLRRFPEFQLAPGQPVTWSQGQVRGPRTLPLILGADRTGPAPNGA
jgi:cytochrome P450